VTPIGGSFIKFSDDRETHGKADACHDEGDRRRRIFRTPAVQRKPLLDNLVS
jgi:hypothetical protein